MSLAKDRIASEITHTSLQRGHTVESFLLGIREVVPHEVSNTKVFWNTFILSLISVVAAIRSEGEIRQSLSGCGQG